MSAWYIFSMMGFYPVNPCGDGYVLGEAQAEEIELRVEKGKFKVVRGEWGTAAAKAMAVESGNGERLGNVVLNGKRVDGVKISHADIVAGGELVFVTEK